MPAPTAKLLQQAVDLHRAGQIDEAVRLYKKVLRKDERAAGALNLLGLAEFQLGHLPEAADALARAARLNPDLPNVDYNLGRVLQAQGQHNEAALHYQRALTRTPNDAEVLNELGTTLVSVGRSDEAIECYRRSTSTNPQFVAAWYNLGLELSTNGRFDEAFAAYSQALALRPDHMQTMGQLAYVLGRLDRTRESIDYSRAAIAAEPNVADHHMNLATALASDGRDEEALQAYDRALAVDPESRKALWNKGLFLLSRARFAEGWPLLEQRWHNASSSKMERRPYAAPRWAGEHVTGTLLAWGEQGLGDQILYSSLLSDLRPRADNIVLEVDPRLVPLMARSFPDITVVSQTEKLFTGPIAAQAALGDLCRYLRPDMTSFSSSAGPYLMVDRARTAALRARLLTDRRRVIGLSWGSSNKDFGRLKSSRLSELLPVLQLPGCRFIDLQYGDTHADREEAERATGVRIERLEDIDNTNDIDGLAALMAACDAVVTVSNTNAHLAAAQGQATFVLLADSGGLFWYWMKRGRTTPFYPSARLFRKAREMSWTDLAATGVVPALTNYLDSLAGATQ